MKKQMGHLSMFEKLALSVPEVVDLTGFSRSTVYEEMALGHLRAIKLGRRVAILPDDLQAWLASLPEVKVIKPKQRKPRDVPVGAA
jgi:excisionase family DNA binding protein